MRLIDVDELIDKLNKFESDVHGSAECYSSVTEIIEAIEYVGILIDETQTVEAVPKSYADQIRWERDVAVGQLNEIGCQFGQKMDEVKKKLESLQWNLCNEKLPEGCDMRTSAE